MSSVLHPVGPEPEERYWVRRVVVLVAAIVAVVVVVALVSSALGSGSAVQAEPAPPTYVPPAATSPTPTDATSATPSDGTSASPTPGATSPGTASPTPTATGSASAESNSPADSSSKKSTSDKSGSKTSKASTKQPTYAACDGDDLRPTLTGDRTVKVKHKTTLELSLINGGKQTCKVAVSAKSATLTIVSGSDRIWTTKDCPAAMPTKKRTLLPEHALTWKVQWSGVRSDDDCSTDKKHPPKAGYYWAIASIDGADDVRFRIILS